MRKKTVIPIDSIPNPVPLLMTVAQVADYLQMPVSSIYEMTRYRGVQKAQVIPYRRIGRYLRFLRSEVEAWVLGMPQRTKLRKRAYRKAVAA